VAGAAAHNGRPESPVPAKTAVPERRSARRARRRREVRRRIMVAFLSSVPLRIHPEQLRYAVIYS